MRRTSILRFAVAFSFAVAPTVATAAGPATRPAAAPPVGATFDQPVNDRAVLDRITTGGDGLIAAGKTAQMSKLVEQLSRKEAALALPAPAAPVRVGRAGTPLPGEEIHDRAAKATLVVGGLYKCDKCAHTHCSPATGYVITASGVAVTNYHVVDTPKNMTLVAMTRDGRVLPVIEVLAADKAQDVAVVRLGAGDGDGRFEPLPLAAADARPGADLFVLSHPDNRFFTFSRGVVSRYFRRPGPGGGGGPVFMQITADYARGSSGGPVLDARGEVVGMVASTASVYYTPDKDNPRNLQMVFKDCVPVAAVRKLIVAPDQPAAAARETGAAR